MCLALAGPAMSQSKKELKNENSALKGEVQRLKTQLDELTKPKTSQLASDAQRVSYSIGVMIGSNIQGQRFDSLDVESVIAGMKDVLENRSLVIKTEEAQTILQEFMQKTMEKNTKKVKDEGTAFLEQNKTQPGVKTTASGLQYKIITEGTGKTPEPTSSVTVHYTGKLINGFVFDSSVERGEPATFRLNKVVRGWTEGLQLLREGGKAMLYLPYELGYGERGGAGGQIPPYAVLIFEVELIKVN
jgi:FKBP-type peptidyl-prolyl cis-trans isomerase